MDAAVAGTPRGEGFHIRGASVLFTYQSLAGPHIWQSFLDFVMSNLTSWKVQYWTATFEENSSNETCHAHLMLQFMGVVDRTTQTFIFAGDRPNAAIGDLLNEGICGKRLQQSIDRGHFY
eukprot:16447224-Heterocapsa_arctica.AAC.1